MAANPKPSQHHPPPWTLEQTYTPVKGDEGPPKNIDETPPDGHYVKITSRALHWDFILLLGDGPVAPSDGTANFDEVTPLSDKAIVYWSGEALWRMDVPLMLDAWMEPIEPPRLDKSPPKFGNVKKPKRRRRRRERWRKVRDRDRPLNVDQYLTQLVELAQPEGKRRPPAALRVYGKAVPRFLNGELWHISGITWGEPMFNPRNGQLVRQSLSLALVEANHGTPYKVKKAKKKKGGGGGKAEHYTVKRGDTLQKIAAKFYGSANKWERIAKANDIKNPRKLHDYIGEKIKIPM